MTTTIVFPCENCICVAICRHKLYTKLLTDCSLLCHYINVKTEEIEEGNLYVSISIISNKTVYFRCLLQTYLNPTVWEVDDKGFFISTRKDLIR